MKNDILKRCWFSILFFYQNNNVDGNIYNIRRIIHDRGFTRINDGMYLYNYIIGIISNINILFEKHSNTLDGEQRYIYAVSVIDLCPLTNKRVSYDIGKKIHYNYRMNDVNIIYKECHKLEKCKILTVGITVVPEEAAGIYRILFNDSTLYDRISEIENEFKSTEEVVKVLTKRGRRRKTELIQHKNRYAVKKTAKPGNEYLIKIEYNAMLKFNPLLEEIPEPLDCGDNFIVLPYFPHEIPYVYKCCLPLSYVHRIRAIIQTFYEHGYYLLDFYIGNFMLDEKYTLKLIDMEWVSEYHNRPSSISESYELKGVPHNISVNLPPSIRNSGGYDKYWAKCIGLPLDSFLYDSYLKQHLKRTKKYIKYPIWYYRQIRNSMKTITNV